MNSEKLSGRQLWLGALVGGLSHAAAFSGRLDWRWALAAAPVGVLLGYLLLRRVGPRPLFQGVGGGILAVVYSGWAVVLMSAVLLRTAERIQITNADRAEAGWILLLIAIPLIWMGWGKSAAFFRTVEIFWLAVVVLLAAVALFALPRIQWQWLLIPVGDWRQSAAAMVLILSAQLFFLPYIYKVEGGIQRGLVWQGALGILAAVLAAVTAGVLSSAVAVQLKEPFFVASGVLGESVRGEGLISALWLLPDLTLAGLLSRVWGGKHRAAFGIGIACALALTELPNFFSTEFLAAGTLVLTALTLMIPTGKGRLVVTFW